MESARMGVVLSPGEKPGDNDSFNQRHQPLKRQEAQRGSSVIMEMGQSPRIDGVMCLVTSTGNFPLSLGIWTRHSIFPAPIPASTKQRVSGYPSIPGTLAPQVP